MRLSCFCVNVCVFLNRRILHTNDYDKHSEKPISLSDNPVIVIVINVELRGISS